MIARHPLLACALCCCAVVGMGGCATALTTPLHLEPGFQFDLIDALEVLPAVDLRTDKTISVDLQKQIRQPVTKSLTKKGYRLTASTTFGATPEVSEEDLREAKPEWVKGLGSSNARWVLVLCLLDVRNKLTFGSTGNAEVSGYLFDKQAGRLSWRDKGIGQVGQGGLAGMLLKGTMDNAALDIALRNTMASVPKRRR